MGTTSKVVGTSPHHGVQGHSAVAAGSSLVCKSGGAVCGELHIKLSLGDFEAIGTLSCSTLTFSPVGFDGQKGQPFDSCSVFCTE